MLKVEGVKCICLFAISKIDARSNADEKRKYYAADQFVHTSLPIVITVRKKSSFISRLVPLHL